MTPNPTGHRVTRELGRGLVAIALVLCPACSSPPGLGPPSGPSTAELWFAAYHDALRQGAFNTGPFYADDASVDLTTLEGPKVTGRESVLQTIGGAFVPFRNQTPEPGALYLSRMGAVEAAPIKGPTEDPNRLLAIDTFGAQGMTSQVFALSVLAWRERQQGDPRMLAVQTVAQDWATAWSGASGTAVADLYAPTATLTDDLMGVRTQSRDEVTALTGMPAQSGGLDQVTVERSDVSGPAVFVVKPPGLRHSDPIRSMAMLVTADEGEGCPGQLAVVLELDEQGRITHEQRYHRADTLTRCVGAGPGAAGDTGPRWWDALTIPPAVAKIQTGSLTLNGRDVAMFNSTPGLDGLITWAADRFTAAGLTPPTVTEVSFYGEHLDVCKGITAHGLATGTTLALCFVEKTACTDPATCTQWTAQAKATALHELGHMWIWAGLDTHTIDDDTTRRFTKQAGLPTWADTDHAWRDRGMELAAVHHLLGTHRRSVRPPRLRRQVQRTREPVHHPDRQARTNHSPMPRSLISPSVTKAGAAQTARRIGSQSVGLGCSGSMVTQCD